MTVPTNVFDGQSLFRSVEALAGSDILFSKTGIVPSVAELELANLPPLDPEGSSAQATTDEGHATAVAGDPESGNGAVAETAEPVVQAVADNALAAAAAAVAVNGGDIPLDTDLALAALLGPTSAVAVASNATLGSGSSAIDVAAAAALGVGGLGTDSGGIPIVGGLLGGHGDGTNPVGNLPLVGDLLGGTGLGSDGSLGGLPIVGPILGGSPGEGGLLHGAPVVGDLVGNLGDSIANATTDANGPLLAEVVHLPLELLGIGDTTGNLEGAVHDVGVVLGGAGTLVNALGDDVGGVLDQPIADTANDLVTDVHAFLEVVGHNVGLNAAIHGVTELGNTVGLGEIGGNNLVTDVLEVPGVVLSGGNLGSQLGDINLDVGDILTAVPPVVSGVVADLSGGPSGIGVTGGDGIVGQVADALSGSSTGSVPLVGDLLGGDSIAVPSLGGAGADSLVGTLLDTVHSATPIADSGGGPLGSLDLGLGDLGDVAALDHHVPDATGHDSHGSLGLGLI